MRGQLSCGIENRLQQAVHTLNGTEQYVYNPSNQRVWKKDASQSETVYMYGPDGARLATMNASWGNGLHFGSTTLELRLGGRLISSAASGDSAGSLVEDRLGSGWASQYFPYGETRSGGAGFQFATYRADSATQFYYAQQRYYSSKVARFLTPDPYVASGGAADPQSWNRYAYVQGDPINFYDPEGFIRHCPAAMRTDDTGFGCLMLGFGMSFGHPTWPPAPPNTVDASDDTRGKPTKHDRQEAKAAAMLQAGIDAALVVLQSSADCRALFAGTDLLGNTTPDPGAFLFTMEEGINDWAFFQVADLPGVPGVVRSAITGPAGYTRTVDIGNGATQVMPVIQVRINDLEGKFLGSGVSSAATTVLHELGHVYYDLSGPNATGIVPDAGNTALSEQNQQKVADACGLKP